MKTKATMAGWKETRLGDVCHIAKKRHNGDLLPYLGLEHIESGTGQLACAPAPAKVKSQTFYFNETHLLYGRLRPYLNKVFLPDFEGHCTTEIFPIQCGPELHRRFLFYWLIDKTTVAAINRTSTGARMPRANVNALLDFKFRIPPIHEQKRIVAILDKAFTAIETATANTKRNIDNVQELFDIALSRVVHAPETGWTENTLGDLCEFRRGLTYKKSDEVSVSSNAVLRANNITAETGKINYDEVRFIRGEIEIPESKKVVPGCLLVCTASGSKKHLGKIGLIEDDSDHAFGGFMGLLVPSERVSAKYLFYLTRSICYRNFIDDLSDGVNINNLRWSQLSQFPILLPPVSHQEKVTAFLDKLSTKNQYLISIYEAKMLAFSEFKHTILRQAFAGKLTANA